MRLGQGKPAALMIFLGCMNDELDVRLQDEASPAPGAPGGHSGGSEDDAEDEESRPAPMAASRAVAVKARPAPVKPAAREVVSVDQNDAEADRVPAPVAAPAPAQPAPTAQPTPIPSNSRDPNWRRAMQMSMGIGRGEGSGGVYQQHLAAIFQPFFRVERELTRKTQGTGIGLSLVRGLAERMGGSVQGANAGPGLEVSVEFVAG